MQRRKQQFRIKSIFGARADESLSACLKNWYSKQSEKSKSHIYAENITGFMTYIEKLTTNDEDEIVSRLSKLLQEFISMIGKTTLMKDLSKS